MRTVLNRLVDNLSTTISVGYSRRRRLRPPCLLVCFTLLFTFTTTTTNTTCTTTATLALSFPHPSKNPPTTMTTNQFDDDSSIPNDAPISSSFSSTIIDDNSNNNNTQIPQTLQTNRASYKELCQAAGGQSLELLQQRLQGWAAAEIDDYPNVLQGGSGKSPLHMAAWKGSLDNLKYLINVVKCDVNAYSISKFSYGKTAIFFAATQSRADVIEYLLTEVPNLHVKIVNNKGQSPLSICASHNMPEHVLEMLKLKTNETTKNNNNNDDNDNNNDDDWWNFRMTHSDGLEYGDLEPRFLHLERPLRETDVVTELAINPTTKESRKGAFARRNQQHLIKQGKGTSNDSNNKKKQQTKSKTKTRPKQRSVNDAWQAIQQHEAWKEVTGSSTHDEIMANALIRLVEYADACKCEWIPLVAMSLLSLSSNNDGLQLERNGAIDLVGQSIAAVRSGNITTSMIPLLSSGDEQPPQSKQQQRIVTLLEKLVAQIKEQDVSESTALNTQNEQEQDDKTQKLIAIRQHEAWKHIFNTNTDTTNNNRDNEENHHANAIIRLVEFADQYKCAWMPLMTTQLVKELGQDYTAALMEQSIETFKSTTTTTPSNKPQRIVKLLEKLATQLKDPGSNRNEQKLTKSNQEQDESNNKSTKRTRQFLPSLDPWKEILQELVASGLDMSFFHLGNDDNNDDDNGSNDSSHRHLILPKTPIFVNTLDQFFAMKENLRPDSCNKSDSNNDGSDNHIPSIVAIDTEWYDKAEDSAVDISTLQVSAWRNPLRHSNKEVEEGRAVIIETYIVDLIHCQEYYSEVKEWIRNLLEAKEILVLGFAIGNDLPHLERFCCDSGGDGGVQQQQQKQEHEENKLLCYQSILDLQLLLLLQDCDTNNGVPSFSTVPGLKACVSIFSPVPLSKEEQCSNWAQRPLTSSQLNYAGMDATILLVLLTEHLRRLQGDDNGCGGTDDQTATATSDKHTDMQ